MIILDTNVVSELMRPSPEPIVVAWIETLTEDVALTAITAAELLAGVALLPPSRRREQVQQAVHGALNPYRGSRAILSLDDEAAVEYAEVLAARTRNGRPISAPDAQIAAICRAHGATLATRNTKDFTGTGTSLIDPWAA